MKLYTSRGELILPKDFAFEISHSNPFFSTEGASSAPVTLPATGDNFDALDHPEETHRTVRAVRTCDAQLQAGLFFAKCKLVVDSASRKGGISVSLALKESVMYGELQDRKLTEIFAGRFDVLSCSPWNIYTNNRVDGWGHPDPVAQEFCCFPVACDRREVSGGDVCTVMNEPNQQGTGFIDGSRTVIIDGQSVTVPQYYGIATFMYLWALIQETFTLCGYTVTENVFKTDSVLKDLVVLHNSADMNVSNGSGLYVVGSHVPYDEIVPDITVGELVGWLRDKFGAVVCAENGEVSVRLFRDVVARQYDLDLTPFMREELTVTHRDQQRLELSMATGIDSASPASDSLEDLIAEYRTRAIANSVADITGIGLFYVPVLGKYYYKRLSTDTPKMVGTDAYRYSRNIEGIQAESIETSDEYVPMISQGGKYMPLIGASVRRRIEVAGDMDENYSQPLMVCYAPFDSQAGHYAGTTTGYSEDGTAISGLSPLNPEAVYEQFWSRYQELIINACPEISCVVDIPMETLLAMDIATPKRLGGDLVLVKSLKFNLGDNGIASCEAVFQQIASYTDAVEVPDIQIAAGTMVWKRVSTRRVFNSGTVTGRHPDGYRVDSTDGLTDYTSADAPDTVPDRAGIVTKYRKRWLTFTKFTSFRSFLSWGTSSRTGTDNYEEYFISTYNAPQQ